MNKEILELLESLNIDKKIMSDDTMEKLSVIFESKINEYKGQVKEQLEESAKEELEVFKEELVEQLNKYLNHFTTEFVAENKESLVEAVEVAQSRKVLGLFNKMVNEFNIQLSEEAIDQTDKIDELSEKYNKVVNENLELKESVSEQEKYAIILEHTLSLKNETDKRKFVKLAENFDYSDESSFRSKLETLSETLDIKNSDEKILKEEITLHEKEISDNQNTVQVTQINETNMSRWKNMV